MNLKPLFILPLIYCCFLNNKVHARGIDSTKSLSKSSVYFEFFGNNFLYSINYELKVAELKTSSFTGRIGFFYQDKVSNEPVTRSDIKNNTTVLDSFSSVTSTFVPIHISWVSHKTKKHHLELGLGATYFERNSSSSNFFGPFGQTSLLYTRIFLVPMIGYRYTSPNGFLFRLTFTPIYNRYIVPQLKPYAGISLGYTIRRKKKNMERF